jgi:hypothetical protein
MARRKTREPCYAGYALRARRSSLQDRQGMLSGSVCNNPQGFLVAISPKAGSPWFFRF